MRRPALPVRKIRLTVAFDPPPEADAGIGLRAR
jgi:hypothetical protein